ncbi:IS982 family transposase, partial [Phormidium sp. FACHB-592]|nr:IS982 family transposase [Phormidium sp. FACHB-592]
METIVSRLDIAHLFYELDDFYQHFEHGWQHQVQLPSMPGERRSHSRLSLSEV